MKYCTNCGAEIGEDFSFCPECGANQTDRINCQEEKTKACKNCGAIMPEDMFYCLECGAPFTSDSDMTHKDVYINHTENAYRPVSNMNSGIWKNKWVSFFLCLFLGGLGIHRFYEGKVFTGLLYLFTLGLFGIGWFVDLIRILLKPNPYRVK